MTEELKRMYKLAGLINENDFQSDYLKKQLSRVDGDAPSDEEMSNVMAAMQKDKERKEGSLEEDMLDEAIEGGLTFDELPDKIKDYFRRNITMSVAFVKKDGSVRHMAFRRNLKSYEKSDKEKSDRQANVLSNNNLMNVYDTNSFIRLKRETGDAAQAAKGSFRNFKLDNVLAFLVGGQLFDMRDQNKIEERFGEEVYAALTPSMISALKSDEAKGSEDVPPYEGPADPMDHQVTEDMIQEGEPGNLMLSNAAKQIYQYIKSNKYDILMLIDGKTIGNPNAPFQIQANSKNMVDPNSARIFISGVGPDQNTVKETMTNLQQLVLGHFNFLEKIGDVKVEYNPMNRTFAGKINLQVKPEMIKTGQVTEDMIQEGELGKAIARILKEELSKK